MTNDSLYPGQHQSGQLSQFRDDSVFLDYIRRWIVGFHGSIAPQPKQAIERRVHAYLRQEDLYREKVKYLLHQLPNTPRIGLDIGSSAGGLSVALALKGISMEGIEPSQSGVAVSVMRAERLRLNNVHFQQGIGEAIPFPDNTFDFVISLAVLEHVQNVTAVLEQTYRVLKPGGYAYFEVPNNLFPFESHYKMAWLPMMPKSLAKLYVKSRGAYPEFLDHLHYMNRLIVSNHFHKAGFSNLRDLYGDFLAGKTAGENWAENGGRLSRFPWAAPAVRLLFGSFPSSCFLNRAVYLLAMKPNQ
jgi:ubiquinone/menaquinone biosynthesis C-methylase UbiE